MSAVPVLPEDVTNGDFSSIHNSEQDQSQNGKTAVYDHTTNGKHISSQWELHDAPVENQRPIKVIVIGCGYSGVYCGIRIPERIRNCELVIYEKNAGIGGTWFENRYPGAACDIPSHSYQFSFNPKPDWSSLYAPSWEIRDYIESTARKYGADRFVKLSHRVAGARWEQSEGKWHIRVERPDGTAFHDTSDILISARGNLNTKRWPDISGLADFKGELIHSAQWNEEYDFSNKRIGLIGSGSSAIQILPQLQKIPDVKVTSFIRGRTWISPPFGQVTQDKYGMSDFIFTPETLAKFRSDPDAWLDFRLDIEADGNNMHAVTFRGTEMQLGAKQAFEEGMRARLSKKPHYFEQLRPSFSPGCKRLTPGPGFLEALVEDNVTYVPDKIDHIEPNAVVTANGVRYEIDVLICATGFYSGMAPPFPVLGLNGVAQQDHWRARATTYLSLATDDFPNYFFMLGPNAAIGEGSLTMMIESVGAYIVKAIRKIQKENIRSMVVKSESVRDFVQYCDTYFAGTVFSENCSSWYKQDGQGKGTSVVTGLWPGSTLHCIEALRSPRWEDFIYEYFPESNDAPHNRLGWLGNGWAAVQLEKAPSREQLAFYILPGFQERDTGIPISDRPEDREEYRIRPWSY